MVQQEFPEFETNSNQPNPELDNKKVENLSTGSSASSSGDEGEVSIKSKPKQSSNEDQVKEKENIPIDGVPQNVPSILELKKSLPAHCFQPNLAKSFYYVFKDMFIMSSLYFGMKFIEDNSTSPLLTYGLALPIYWFLQGTMMWAVFVLGHDCGHGSFSGSVILNDIMGNFLHSSILVPYYPWKLSHHHHHKNTGNIDRDEIFYPIREKDYKKAGKDKYIPPLFAFGIGWMYYLIFGYSPRPSNHFNPSDPLFARNFFNCLISVLSWTGWVAFALMPFTAAYGINGLIIYYLIPVFIFGSWLVVTTFLHHQDENVPWYSNDKWTFVLGNLSSVDRHYGWAHELVHNIGTHQIHHLFIKIPHYNLEEATEAFRKKYPHLVRISHDRILPAFVKMFYLFVAQQWIKDDTEIHVYSSKAKVH